MKAISNVFLVSWCNAMVTQKPGLPMICCSGYRKLSLDIRICIGSIVGGDATAARRLSLLGHTAVTQAPRRRYFPQRSKSRKSQPGNRPISAFWAVVIWLFQQMSVGVGSEHYYFICYSTFDILLPELELEIFFTSSFLFCCCKWKPTCYLNGTKCV